MSFAKRRLSSFNRVFLLFLAFSLGATPVLQAQAYYFAACENGNVIPHLERDTSSALEQLCSAESPDHHAIASAVLRMQLYPTAAARRTTALRFACTHEARAAQQAKKKKQVTFAQPQILDPKSCQDLELLAGSKSHPLAYVAGAVDRTTTELGRITLYKNIVHPTDDITRLRNNQVMLKELLANQALFDSLDKKLKALSVPENGMISFFGDRYGEQDMFKDAVSNYLLSLPLPKQANEWLSKSPVATALQDAESMMGHVGLSIRNPLVVAMLATSGLMSVCNVDANTPANNLGAFRTGVRTVKEAVSGIGAKFELGERTGRDLFSLVGWLGVGADALSKSKINLGINQLGGAWYKSKDVFQGYKGFKARSALLKNLHAKLRHISTYLRYVKSIADEVSQNDVLSDFLPRAQQLNYLHGKAAKEQKELKEVLALLNTNTFKSDFSLLSFAGRILVAYNRVDMIKHLMEDTMLAVGELDAVMSSARLVKEFESKRVRFCFPTYEQPIAGKPALAINEFWNPMINPDKVVTNSCQLGGNGARNMIITGPNAGGKSTILKGAVISVIMAQTLGIAPAASMTFTPFSKITAYLNITDDIAEGNSHFKAGVKRAKEVIENVKDVQAGQVTLTMVDELFNGTSHREGEAAAYSFTKMLGGIQHNIGLACSHFSLVPTLAQKDASFVNCKVSVDYDAQGKIVYPFKLMPGVSNQVITLKILEEEGFGKQFIDDARQVLNQVR